MQKMIHISAPIIGKKEISAVNKVLKSGQLAAGPEVEALENNFAKFCGAKYAVAVTSGTAALHTALYCLGIGKGDEVITSPFTFIATANAIKICQATPIFADISETDFNIDPNSVEKMITSRTKAILAVNLYGQTADYYRLQAIAKKNHLYLIEDAAQSVGATYNQRYSGNLTDAACFSFYATKNIMSGEGGIVTTNNNDLCQKMQRFTDQGQPKNSPRYTYQDMGINYQPNDVLAAIARVQLSQIDTITKKRQRNAALYSTKLRHIPGIITPAIYPERVHVFHQYTIRVTKHFPLTRDQLADKLKELNIQTNVYYPLPLYRINHLKPTHQTPDDYPVTEKIVSEVLSLPVHPKLKIKEINQIVHAIKKIFQDSRR